MGGRWLVPSHDSRKRSFMVTMSVVRRRRRVNIHPSYKRRVRCYHIDLAGRRFLVARMPNRRSVLRYSSLSTSVAVRDKRYRPPAARFELPFVRPDSRDALVETISTTMTTTIVPQMRRLSSRSGVDSEWLRKLFDFMDGRPRSAIYSMAFALSCFRTYNLSERNIHTRPEFVAEFEAARELLDLLEDNVNATDTFDAADLRRGRAFDTLDFARANDLYVASFDHKYVPVIRWYDGGAARTTTNESTNDAAVDAVANEISRVLKRVNEHAAGGASIAGMRIPANSRCSISVERVDLSPFDAAACNEGTTTDNVLRDVLSRRVVPTVDTVGSPSSSYTYFELYAAYAPIVYRYESLDSLISRWNEQHTTSNSGGDDEAIRWILLPARGVWQGGTSQILWIVMHTLAALTVQRRNGYIHRALAILERMSFYVWCAECSMHWSANRGDEYFRHVSSLPRAILRGLPIDIVLLRCHNVVNANSTLVEDKTAAAGAAGAGLVLDDRDGVASKWTLANLCLDYRDYAAIGLLRRGDRESARSYRAAICRPMVRAVEKITSGNGVAVVVGNDDENYLLSRALVDSGRRRFTVDGGNRQIPSSSSSSSSSSSIALQNLLLDSQKHYYGEILLRKLWYDIDPSTNVPICALY